MADLDRAVGNVLRLKFQMGLFENPYVSPELAKKLVHSKEHKELARQVAREGVVLLKNEGVLPLSKHIGHLAVIGPNADEMYNQLGDYTAPQVREEVATVLDGIRAAVSESTRVTYVKGCAVRDTTATDIPAAVAAAQKADAVVLVVGGSSARDLRRNTSVPVLLPFPKMQRHCPIWIAEKGSTVVLYVCWVIRRS